ncbi:NACHT, LRR and PYD domains-containing protein 6-like [Carcharodon carcharias]|uniref:NACHT, LRR and PYD domains-containing protein 6-like n=1 Tax=Carcharodon carcharias TaxID=13397 RepID=UPI001B7DEA08|nr:NACHT, LRR and PYD domains-containing protein 6-like [Carcharodon carcharias]
MMMQTQRTEALHVTALTLKGRRRLERLCFGEIGVTCDPSEQSAPVLTCDRREWSVPLVSCDPSERSAPAVTCDPSERSAPAVTCDPSERSAPAVTCDPSERSAPAVTCDRREWSVPLVSCDPSERSAPAVTCDPSERSAPVLTCDRREWSVPLVSCDPSERSAPAVTCDPSERSAPAVSCDPSERSAPAVSCDPSERSAPLVSCDPSERSAPAVTCDPSKRSVPLVSCDPSEQSAPAVTCDPSKRSAPAVTCDPSERSAPSVTCDPSKRSAPAVTCDPSERSVPLVTSCQAELKRWVTEWTSRIDQHKVPWGRRKSRRAVRLEDRYTELIVVTTHRLGGSRYNEMVDAANIHESLSSQPSGGPGSSRPLRAEHLFRRSYSGPRLGPAPLVVAVSGVPGIGKTTMVQKLLHDWAAGKVCRQFSFVFHYQFRELNLLGGERSLVGLIVGRHPFLESSVHRILRQPEEVLFILDGLDESREELDFASRCCHPEGMHPVPALVAGLVSQQLLRGCSVLVTSRPGSLKTLEPAGLQAHAEVLGFLGPQRRRYFEKFYGQRAEGPRVYRHVRGHGVLYTLCFNPSYCWILCSALEGQFTRRRGGAECRPPPRTVTQLFGLFLANLLTNHARHTPHLKRAVLRVGRLAYAGVKGRRLVFYQPELREHGLGSSPFLSGFLTEFLERDAASAQAAFSFLHLTVQEFLAALRFFLGGRPEELSWALGEAAACPDGRYEVFSRFLAGLANPANTHALDGPLGGLSRRPCSLVLDWLLEGTRASAETGDKRALLQALHRLFEAQHRGLVQRSLGRGARLDLAAQRLNPVDCSALAYALGCLDRAQCLDVSSSIAQPEGLDRLLPHLRKCKEIRLDNNNLGDVGMQKLCAELRIPGGIFTTLQVIRGGFNGQRSEVGTQAGFPNARELQRVSLCPLCYHLSDCGPIWISSTLINNPLSLQAAPIQVQASFFGSELKCGGS